jgi:hypothetical protein
MFLGINKVLMDLIPFKLKESNIIDRLLFSFFIILIVIYLKNK